MYKFLKKHLYLGIFALILASMPVFTYGMDTPVRLILDGNELYDLREPPVIVNDRILVPFRDVFERVGGIVGWHSVHRQVSLFYGDDVLVLTIDETNANLNGNFIQMHTSPIIYNGRAMVPLRFPAEVFGFDVHWDASKRAAILNSPGNGNSAIETTEPSYEYEQDESDKVDVPWKGTPDGETLPPPGATIVQGKNNPNLARNVSSSTIQTIPHPQTSITALQTPLETGTSAYVIVASSAISQVHYFLLPDNRLVLDIHNAVSLICGHFYAPANVPVSGVRASQFSQAPRVTRVVFDVVGAAEYSLSLSADRTFIAVSFAKNRISGVFTQSNTFSDSLFIQGDVFPAVSISTEGFPHFLTIDIASATMGAGSGAFSGGIFASHFTTGQRADGSSYVRVYISGAWPSFSIAHSYNTVEFMMHHGVLGIRYDSINRELLISRSFAMDINQVQHIDNYSQFRYTFVLPPAAEVLGRGEISVFDGFVNYVVLSRDTTGNMLLTLNNARVLTFSIHEETNYFVIRAHIPRDIFPFIVVIDPGHGGFDPGTAHHGVVEKEVVLSVSLKVVQLLDADPFITAYMTRREDTFVSLFNRAGFANYLGADLFVSVHANAAEKRRGVINPYVHGIETWYTISAREQAGNHSINSRQFAQIMQRHKIQSTGAHDRGLRHEPNLVVLRETNMPSVLLELGFITNSAEAALLANPAYQWQLAQAIYQGIVEAFAAHSPTR